MNHNAWVQGVQRSRGFEKFRLHSCEGAEMEACGLRSSDTRSIPCASGAVSFRRILQFQHVCLNVLQVAAFHALGRF